MAAGTSRRSFAIAREIYCAETLAYRDSHAARARVGEGRVGDRPLGFWADFYFRLEPVG
jgi:hypothetical protein